MQADRCPAGWTLSNTFAKCYKRVTDGVAPMGCNQACQAAGAEMLCVENAYEENFIFDLARVDSDTCGYTTQSNCVWLGLYQTVTTQGSGAGWNSWYGRRCQSTYRHWQPGEPNDWGAGGEGSGDENCAFMGFLGTRTWYDAPCSMQAACFCERHAGPPLPPLPPQPQPPPPPPPPPPPHPQPPSTCGAGWVHGAQFNKCYRALPDLNTAEGCSVDCQEVGGSQLCVSSQGENDFVANRVLETTPATCGYTSQEGCGWLGLYQTVTTQGAGSHWNTWRSGCTTTYRNWNPGEPNVRATDCH